MSSYIRLERHNDWGVDYLSLPGKGLSPYGTANAKTYGIQFRAGQSVRVRWPDNTQTTETVALRTVCDTVYDMGHEYPVSFQQPGVETSVRGTVHWTPLADLDVLDEDVLAIIQAGPKP